MEIFIKEGKSGFDFAAISIHSKVVNVNRMRLRMIAYNLFNWFRRLVLRANMRKQQVDTIRLMLMKIAFRRIGTRFGNSEHFYFLMNHSG